MKRYVRKIVLACCLLWQPVFGETVHRVKEGESLWLIAKRAGVSVDAIRKANNLTSDVIWEGTNLILPAPQRSSTPVKPVPEVKPQLIPARPALVVPSAPASPQSKGPLSEKGMQILRLQVNLDRAGFSPGRIDGYEGKYTRLAQTLCEAWNPTALRANLSATQTVRLSDAWKKYVDPSLPGSGRAPDFKALTRKPQVIRYYSALEYFGERFHCSEGLLKKLNPQIDFSKLRAGVTMVVPNVEPFKIEDYFDSQGRGVWASGLGKAKKERMIFISATDMTLTIWEDDQLVRGYPITLNEEDSPRGRRELGAITPGPTYMRKKTGLDLLPGPNSPVGIVWCPLGNGFGIHGTNNPDTIGRATSSGCVRLANWDAVRFASLVRKGTKVFISEKEKVYRVN